MMARTKKPSGRSDGRVDIEPPGQMSDKFLGVRHIGAKKYVAKVVEKDAEFLHNNCICPMCGQRVHVRMTVPYCNGCLETSRHRAEEGRKKKVDRWVMKEIIDVQRIEEKMSERAEEFHAS